MKYSRSAITQLTKWYKQVLIKCALLNAAIFVSMGSMATNADAAAPTPTNGENAAYTWIESGANTGISYSDGETTYYVDIKKTKYNSDTNNLTYDWNDTNKVLTVTKDGGAVDIANEYIGNHHNTGVYNPNSVNGWLIGNSAYYGGAVFIQEKTTDTPVNAHFIGNSAIDTDSGYAGALYSELSTISSIVGDFIGNRGQYGGAIASRVDNTITSITGDFIGNSVSAINGHPNGGAIFLQNNASITTIEGNFVGNTAITNSEGYYALGGAIANRGGSNISTINADFVGNLASAPGNYANGGAIYNDGESSISLVNGEFRNNSADMGGAIYNGVSSTITKITGKFVGNSVSAGSNDYSVGGAIVNANNAHIGEIEADFTNNSAKDSNCDQGGAIFVGLYSTIDSITGNFVGNTAKNNSGDGFGGAIYTLSSTINTLTGNFENNTADWGGAIYNEKYVGTETKTLIGNLIGNFTNNSASFGGAILNNSGVIPQLTGNFENNSATRGGAIFNLGTFNAITGDFIGNSATLDELSGGAIYNTGSGTINLYDSSFRNNKGIEGAAIFVNSGAVSVTAKTKDIEFTNNNTTGTAEGTGTGIQTAENGTLNLATQNGRKITINDSIALNGTTNINGDVVLGTANAANSFANTANLRISGGTLNIANNNIDTLSFANTINNLNDFNLIIDVDAGETVTADKITAGLNYANYVYLSALNFMNDSSQSGEVQIADGYLKGLVKLANNFDSGIYTTVGYNKTTGILSFADPVNWTKRTNGVNSIYKWTKTNTELMPVFYNDQTFYVDILKKSYTDDSHYDHLFKYTWDNENHILTVTNSDDSALVTTTGTRTGAGTKEDPYNFAGDYIGGSRVDLWKYIKDINGNYIGHTNSGDAGVFYISYDADLITTINANFIGNKTINDGDGGAIKNWGTISHLTGDFIGNKAHISGGAIYNGGQIQAIKGDYIGNTSKKGGAIYNYRGSTINSITGNFINNHATSGGGAIYNGVGNSSYASAATIGSISGNFINNQTEGYGGGAIHSINSNISSIDGNFIGNCASDGGAIYLEADEYSPINPVIDSITGKFENNYAKYYGGAIDTNVYDEAGKKMTINTIAADFIGNTAENSSGGAVYNYYNITIGTLTGKFENNSSNDSSGGALYNSGTINTLTADFENNSAAYYGGAIYNSGTLNIVDSSFTGNKATLHGGAIYSYWGTTNIIAKDKNVAFTNNNTTGTPEGTDYGIYVTSGTLGLNANTDKAITINDDIYLSSESYTSVNLNINTDENYHNGTVEFNGALIVDTTKLNTTLGGGTVKLGTDAATVNLRNMTVSGNTTLDLQNNNAGDILSVSNYNGTANLSLNLDYNGEGTIDRMYIGNSSASGNIVLNSIKVLADGNATYTQFLTSPSDDIIVTTSNPEDNTKLIVANDNYNYTFTLSDYFGYLEVSRTALGSNLATAIADATVSSYTMGSDFTFDENGQGTLAGDGRNFTIFGQDHVIDGGGTYSYIRTSAGQTLSIENVTFQNMSPAIRNQGNLNLKNVSFAAQDYTDITNDGILNLDGTNTVNHISWYDDGTRVVNVNGGTTTVSGAIYYQNELNVAEGATLILGNGYSSIQTAFDNKGTVQINGQLNVYNGNLTNSGTISGDGFIVIGAGDSEAYLENTGTIHNLLATDKGTVKTAVENVTGTINNRGTLLLSGTLNKSIYKGNTSSSPQGVIKIDGTLKIDASGVGDKTIYTSSMIDPNGGTLDMKNNQIDTLWVSSNKTVGTGNLTLDVDLSGATVKSDVFYATGTGPGSTNTDTLTVTDLNIIGELKPFEAQILKGDVYHRSLLLDDAVTAKYNKTEISTRYESDDLTATASWNDTFNSKKYETETVKKLETYAADSYTPYHQGLRYTETTGPETLVEETPLSDTLSLLNQTTQFGATERKFVTSDANAVHNVTADLGTTAAGQMTVQGATDGENTSTIDLKGKDGFEVGEGAEVVLDTVKIVGAKAADGALINNESGTVTLKDVEVAENSKAAINNGSTMNLSGTNNIESGIGGDGTTNITDGKTKIAAKLSQKKLNIKSGAALETNADNVDAPVVNNGTYDVTGGTINNKVAGGELKVKGDVTVGDKADVKTASANVAKGASLDVGTNSVDLGDTTIDGTIKLEITDIAAGSDRYSGGQINATSLNLGKDSKLSLTIAPNLIAKKTSTGALDIINVSGATTGEFAEMMSNNRYKLTADKDGKFVITNFASVADIINEAGGSGNNIATGETWDETTFAAGSKAVEVQNVLNELSQHDEKGYVKALTDLAPSDSMAHVGLTQDFNNLVSEQIEARQQQKGLSSGDMFAKRGAWIQMLYNHSKQDKNDKNQGFTGKTKGVALGLDGEISDKTTVGIGYAYGKTDVDSAGRDMDVNGHTVYVYGKYQPSAWYIRGLAHYGFAEYEEKANIAGVANKAEYDVHNYGARAFVGYDLPDGFTPEAGLRITRIERKNYTDSVGQHVKTDGINVLTASMGMNYSTTVIAKDQTWAPKAHVALTYDILSDDSNATVEVGNGVYNVEGKKLNRFGVEGGVGIEYGIGNWELSAEYDLGARKDYLSHTGMLKAKYNF